MSNLNHRMESRTKLKPVFRKSQVLAPVVWFSVAWGHFPSICATFTNSLVWKLLISLYCALFNLFLFLEVILSTYLNFTRTGTTAISFALLINHLCYVCASFVSPLLTWLRWKEWQSIIREESEKRPPRKSLKLFVASAVMLGFVFNLLLFTWIIFLASRSGSMVPANSHGLTNVADILSFVFTVMQSFTHSVVPIQFFVCCWLVRGQLQNIRHNLERKVLQEPTDLDHVLEMTRKSVVRTSETVDKINRYFGIPLLFLLSAKIARSITNLYSIIHLIHRTSNTDRLFHSVFNIYYLCLDISALAVILWGAESISRQLSCVQIEVSVASFFILGKRLCPSIIGAALTYIFVLMQFDQSEH